MDQMSEYKPKVTLRAMLFNDYLLLKSEKAYLLISFPENQFLVPEGVTGLHDLLFSTSLV